MSIKKSIIKMIIATLFLQSIPLVNLPIAFAEENTETEDIYKLEEENFGKIDDQSIYQYYDDSIDSDHEYIFDVADTTEMLDNLESDLFYNLEEELVISEGDDLEIEVTSMEEETLSLEVQYENEDVDASFDIEYDLENLVFNVSSEVLEDDETYLNNFTVDVLESEEDLFVAVFKDDETGKEYLYDSSKLEASILPAVPVAVYLVSGLILRQTVKYVGKQAILYIGKKSFKQVAKTVARSALKSFKPYKVQSGKKQINLTSSGMEHILQRHHPKYWTGSVEKTQSFLDPNLGISNIRTIIVNGIKNNQKTILTKINNKNTPSSGFSVVTNYKGSKYRIWFSKSGRVNTMYPIK